MEAPGEARQQSRHPYAPRWIPHVVQQDSREEFGPELTLQLDTLLFVTRGEAFVHAGIR